nr:MAG TPA: hypothetical protein [Caudoviricetes sp.]
MALSQQPILPLCQMIRIRPTVFRLAGFFKAKNHPVSPVKNSSPSNCRIIFMMPIAILALTIFLNIPPKTATQTRFSFPVMLPPFWTALNPQSTPPFKPSRSLHQPHPASARIFPPKFFLSLNCIDTSNRLKNREHPRFQTKGTPYSCLYNSLLFLLKRKIYLPLAGRLNSGKLSTLTLKQKFLYIVKCSLHLLHIVAVQVVPQLCKFCPQQHVNAFIQAIQVLLHTLQLLVKRVAAPFHRFQPLFKLVYPGILVFVWLFQKVVELNPLGNRIRNTNHRRTS